MSTVDEAVTALRTFKNAILEGPPGTGKSYSISEVATAWRRPLGVDVTGAIANGSGAWAVTFHPSTGYEEFVEGIRYNPEVDTSTSKPKGFELRSGVFRHWVSAALSQPDKDFLVLIDEINRANVSRVLGDLLLGLEASKRLHHESSCSLPDGEHGDCWTGGTRTQLAYSTEILGVPDNLYVLGTMNSSDRSIAPLDSALRRRFAFVRVNPLSGTVLRDRMRAVLPTVGDEVIGRSVEALDHLNAGLRQSLGPDGVLGHSYLFELDATRNSTRCFWMELDSVAVHTGSQLQVTKDWADRLLAVVSPGATIKAKGTSVELDLEYNGVVYQRVKLENPTSGNIRFSANATGMPFSDLSDGVGLWTPTGTNSLRLNYDAATPGRDRKARVAILSSRSTWTRSSSTRQYGVIEPVASGRGDEEERTIWRYSILPQLIDTVTQAYAPDLMVPARRDRWIQENIPDDPTRAAVLDALAAFDLFLNGVLRLQVVRAGHGLSVGLAIEELFAPSTLDDAPDSESGAEADDSADGAGG